jgi:hypothetical protein
MQQQPPVPLRRRSGLRLQGRRPRSLPALRFRPGIAQPGHIEYKPYFTKSVAKNSVAFSWFFQDKQEIPGSQGKISAEIFRYFSAFLLLFSPIPPKIPAPLHALLFT